MRKTIKALALLCMVVTMTLQVGAASIDKGFTNIIESFQGDIKFNDFNIGFQGDSILINQQVFVPIRELAILFEAKNILWEEETQSVTITTKDAVIIIANESNEILVNGETEVINQSVSIINGTMYVPIRAFSKLLGAEEIEWDNMTRTVLITKPNLVVKERFLLQRSAEVIEEAKEEPKEEPAIKVAKSYSDEDLYWLSRIIEAESRGEPYQGKLAVANVVINRKKSSLFPNNIKDVIFDRQYGVQFTPAYNGMIYNNPGEESIKAAIEALEGNNNIGNALYFVPTSARGSWVATNRTYHTQISGHAFYL
ncbi:N-acetylmuramoyl-L-alanine amidase [Natranaerovirga pectinivora]|uniref:N-acetylmuramoyl-L-alanine amidase n=1 Tax=Natranaerovirga pectinivora TaxID=682400 RepID=A0A4R3MLY6_9FIRM|nr:cell wall hydrolase [Natranaerovirga pectinivora]TCT15722.1 N-acetylmuramoyl-L-alanine amidase [Natranaerovirga pectinivora]